MKSAKMHGKTIEAGAGAPERAMCPHCGAEVLLRRRKNIDGESWYWRQKAGESRGCPGRSLTPISNSYRKEI